MFAYLVGRGLQIAAESLFPAWLQIRLQEASTPTLHNRGADDAPQAQSMESKGENAHGDERQAGTAVAAGGVGYLETGQAPTRDGEAGE